MSDTRDHLNQIKSVIDELAKDYGKLKEVDTVTIEVFQSIVHSIDELYQEIEVLKREVGDKHG